MASWRKTAVGVANRVLRPTRLRLTPAAVLDACTRGPGCGADTFRLAGRDYPYFVHHHNCGFPAAFATERTVELAVADEWLRRVPAERVIEVGAVSPYYWPGRVRTVVDPADPHPQVTRRCPMDQVDLRGACVLSVSTLEHFGCGDYGLPVNPHEFAAAIDQLAREPAQFLATLPVGYNPAADDWLFGGDHPAGVRVAFLLRDRPRMGWRQVPAAAARVPYARGTAADAVAVVERGGVMLDGEPA